MKTARNMKLSIKILESGLSQKNLSKKSGLTEQTISRLVRNSNPTPETAEMIAGALGCDISDIFECVYSKKLHLRNTQQ